MSGRWADEIDDTTDTGSFDCSVIMFHTFSIPTSVLNPRVCVSDDVPTLWTLRTTENTDDGLVQYRVPYSPDECATVVVAHDGAQWNVYARTGRSADTCTLTMPMFPTSPSKSKFIEYIRDKRIRHATLRDLFDSIVSRVYASSTDFWDSMNTAYAYVYGLIDTGTFQGETGYFYDSPSVGMVARVSLMPAPVVKYVDDCKFDFVGHVYSRETAYVTTHSDGVVAYCRRPVHKMADWFCQYRYIYRGEPIDNDICRVYLYIEHALAYFDDNHDKQYDEARKTAELAKSYFLDKFGHTDPVKWVSAQVHKFKSRHTYKPFSVYGLRLDAWIDTFTFRSVPRDHNVRTNRYAEPRRRARPPY